MKGLLCRGIGERMISRDPDMTRLLDRVKQDLIARGSKDDRRIIKTRITGEGLAFLKKLDQPVRELHKRQFGHMKTARMKALAELLEEVAKREPLSGWAHQIPKFAKSNLKRRKK